MTSMLILEVFKSQGFGRDCPLAYSKLHALLTELLGSNQVDDTVHEIISLLQKQNAQGRVSVGQFVSWVFQDDEQKLACATEVKEEDPVGFMKNYLQDCKSSIQPESEAVLGCSATPAAPAAAPSQSLQAWNTLVAASNDDGLSKALDETFKGLQAQPVPDANRHTDTPPVEIRQPDQPAAPPGHAPPGRAPPGRPPGAPPKGGRPGRPPGRPPAGGPPGAKAGKTGGPAKPAPKMAGTSMADELARRKANLRSVAAPQREEEPADTLAAEAEAAARAAEAAAEVAKLRELAGRTPLGIVAVDDVLTADDAASGGGRSMSSVLGRGRFASVTLAKLRVQQAGTWRDVALAAKRFATSSNSSLCAARREADALLTIGLHPHVVELLGLVLPSPDDLVASGRKDLSISNLQLLLRPSEGSLYQLLASASEWEALARGGQLDLLVGVGRGLCAMHGSSFAHLDVKSHNVLVDRQAAGGWIARICDLGSAHRVIQHGPPPPAEGTSGWTAPEILDRHPAATVWPDPRLADVFSFGVVIWEVVSGPSIDHPLCGLAGEAYCAALAEGRRPPFPVGSEDLDEVRLAAECWQLEAQRRPTLFRVTDRLAHRRQVLQMKPA